MSGHAGHLGSLLAPVLLLALWAAWSDVRAAMHKRGHAVPSTTVLLAAALSGGAATIHAVVTPEHLSEDLLYGSFFAGVTLAQLLWAVLIVARPDARLFVLGAVANLAVVALWLQTRLVEIPVGISAGRTEPFGLLDTTCGVLELAVATCCAAVLLRSSPARNGNSPWLRLRRSGAV